MHEEVASGCSPAEEEIVYVVNTLPVDSSPMIVNCKFGSQDLGSHVLYHDQDFHWSFCESNQGKTLSCQVWWGSKKTSFDAFKESGRHISSSFWSARSDGIYLRDSVGNERKVNWNN
ncbi:hypothetical protein C2S51_032304 [Perilla frutescens var. frutescens]|nr:hypothetical protein C2S51_032304 [Perilla frutescens var. frutescens]